LEKPAGCIRISSPDRGSAYVVKCRNVVPAFAFTFTTLLLNQFFYASDAAGENGYSFIVAGHTYGKPGVDNTGLHPPFKNAFDYIRNIENIRFAFLTGDIVWQSTNPDWDEVDSDLRELGFPVHFAPGNHDLSNRELYLKRYGHDGGSYYSFPFREDLFIVLDPNIDGWDISGNQLEFLKLVLAESEKYRNIFIFAHQLIWWDSRTSFKHVDINSYSGRKTRLNFWAQVAPLFKKINNEVFLFSGDTGAFEAHTPVYLKLNNLHLIASGMGGGINDNFVIVHRPGEYHAEVKIETRWLAQATTRPFVAENIPSYQSPYADGIDNLADWRDSGKGILAFRVDPENPQIALHRLHKMKVTAGKQSFKLSVENGQASLILKPVNFRENHRIFFHIVADSPAKSVMRLYYKTSSNKNFGEQKPFRIPLGKGYNDIYLELEIENLKNELRLDPRLREGKLSVATLEVLMFSK